MKNDSPFHRFPQAHAMSRREFLWRSGGGLGGLAPTSQWGMDRALASEGMLPGRLHFPAKAKRVVQFFMAASSIPLRKASQSPWMFPATASYAWRDWPNR